MQIFQIILFDRIQDAASLGNPFSGEKKEKRKKKKRKKKKKGKRKKEKERIPIHYMSVSHCITNFL